jgi:hypothetical protein
VWSGGTTFAIALLVAAGTALAPGKLLRIVVTGEDGTA